LECAGFQTRKVLVTGLAVAGFGFGATLWVKLAGSWFGGLLNTTSLFGLPGVLSVFIIYGIVFLIVVLIGSVVMVDLPKDYKPKGWKQDSSAKGAAAKNIDFSSRQMLKTPQ